jgi:hypothetical protein
VFWSRALAPPPRTGSAAATCDRVPVMTFLYSLINWFAISIGNAISIRANWFLYDTVLEVISKQELVLS